MTEKKGNLILYGSVGTSKSHLATAISIEACNRGKRVKFSRTAALANMITNAKLNGELRKVMKQIGKFNLLIYDE